jgi:predicted RNase H-like HicB family nuclease
MTATITSSELSFSGVDPQTGITIPSAYLEAAMGRLNIQPTEDHGWFAEIIGFDGVWANGRTVLETVDQVQSALVGWLLLKIEDRDGDIPVVNDIDLNE